MKFIVKKSHSFLSWLLASNIASFLKCNILLLGKGAALSCFSMFMPLTGYFFNTSASFLLVCFSLLLKWKLSIYTVTLGIPTIIGTWCWAIENKNFYIKLLLHLGLPLFCTILFLCHPIGYQAAGYTLFWLIPIVLFFIKKEHSILASLNTALSVTFIMHATGSVLWMYAMPTTAHYWIALIPVVAIERLLIAVGMASIHVIILYAKAITKDWSYKILTNNR